jgi:hypothetical protein
MLILRVCRCQDGGPQRLQGFRGCDARVPHTASLLVHPSVGVIAVVGSPAQPVQRQGHTTRVRATETERDREAGRNSERQERDRRETERDRKIETERDGERQ